MKKYLQGRRANDRSQAPPRLVRDTLRNIGRPLFGSAMMHAVGAGATCALLLFTGGPLQAAETSNRMCMTRIENVKRGAGRALVISIPNEQADKYSARGFSTAPCPPLRDTRVKEAPACQAVRVTDPIQANVIWHRFGLRPEELCQEAQFVELRDR